MAYIKTISASSDGILALQTVVLVRPLNSLNLFFPQICQTGLWNFLQIKQNVGLTKFKWMCVFGTLSFVLFFKLSIYELNKRTNAMNREPMALQECPS